MKLSKLLPFLFLLFFIFYLVYELVSFQVATSVVPGWHATALAPHQVLWLPLYAWGAFIVFCYVIAARKKRNLPERVSIVYLVFTIPYPLFLTYFNHKGSHGYEWNLKVVQNILTPALITFLIGQLFFLFFFAKGYLKSKQ